MWKYNQSPGKQSGFTLVELAIVLVIIGLILAAVLKGQEMIENAKVKNVVNDLKGVSVAYYAYQDRYKAIPGDDAAAANHFTGGVNGGGNGTIIGLYMTKGTALAAGDTAESEKFWLGTRLAGFMTGSGSNPPNNSQGGLLGIQSEISAAGGTTYGMTGPVVCAGGIPWKISQAVDIMIDDGNSDTGSVRAGAAGVVNLATAAGISGVYGTGVATGANDTLHTLCMKI